MNVTDGEEPFKHGEYIDWKPLFDKEDNLVGAASEDFIEKMLQHPKVIEAFVNSVSDNLVGYCTPESYEEFAKHLAKTGRTQQAKKNRAAKAKPYYTQLMGRWAQ